MVLLDIGVESVGLMEAQLVTVSKINRSQTYTVSGLLDAVRFRMIVWQGDVAGSRECLQDRRGQGGQQTKGRAGGAIAGSGNDVNTASEMGARL